MNKIFFILLVWTILVGPLIASMYLCAKLPKYQMEAMLVSAIVWTSALEFYRPKRKF